jgi:uncharacterized OB-fold protein
MAMKERISQPRKTAPWYGELPVESRYTVGIPGEKFLRTLKDRGRFTATHCPECGEVFVPPKMFCERCFCRLEDWVTVGPGGTLESWTMVTVGLDGRPLDDPKLVGLIRLDGATTSMVHYLDKVKAEDLVIGMRVTAVLKPAKQRKGSILDVAHFKPGK